MPVELKNIQNVTLVSMEKEPKFHGNQCFSRQEENTRRAFKRKTSNAINYNLFLEGSCIGEEFNLR
jgi:hypothetical protein